MALSPTSLLFFLVLLFLGLLPPFSSSNNSPLRATCSKSTYNSSSTYASTLNLLLVNISSIKQLYPFFTTVVAGNPFSQIFGLAQCRPDTDAQSCDSCIQNGTTFSKDCPFSRSAALRYDRCLIRYSDQPFFGLVGNQNWEIRSNKYRAWDPLVFKERVMALLLEVAGDASKVKTRFAVGNRSSGRETEWIYAMAWCTMDLSSETCLECLIEGIGYINFEMIGARIIGNSCTLRFEIVPFNQEVTAHPLTGDAPNDTVALSSGWPAYGGAGENGKITSQRRIVSLISITLAAALVLI